MKHTEVKVKVEFVVQYPEGTKEDEIDINDIIRDVDAIKDIKINLKNRS